MNDNKSKTLKLNNETIESMFYDIRDEKVMLDLDLAAIFGYETKDLNRMVKNNIDKFDDEFRFQINKNEWDEILKCKNFTSSWGGSRRLPHAFTIDGIKTLITILKPKTENTKENILLLNQYINNTSNQITEKWPSEANNYEIVKFESGNIMLDVRVSPNEDTI